MKIKYIGLSILCLAFFACNEDDDNFLPEDVILPELVTGSADFSNYIALGASFTAGFTDGAVFVAGQENSFPNTLAKQFANAGGGAFTQPLMSDNIGGFVFGSTVVASPRLFFDGAGPAVLPATPTTEVTTNIFTSNGPFTNMGVPGAKSTHINFVGYGSSAGNPYFARMASSPAATMLDDAIAQSPTFFTLSEIGGNDVLGYATTGGDGTDPITATTTFDFVFTEMVDKLVATGAKGAVTNVPYITDLPHFTTVPFAPLSPANESFGPLIPTLNNIFGLLNQVFVGLQVPERSIVFSETSASAVVIHDESLPNLASPITAILASNPMFSGFVQSLGVPVAAVPAVAGLFGLTYGQARQANASDLLVFSSSTIIGTVNTDVFAFLQTQGLSPAVAGQFSVEGVTNPLADKWVLLPTEQDEIKQATDAYNMTIAAVASANDNLVLVDLNAVLTEIASTGIDFDGYNLNANLVTGGAVSLDGIHLNARGYALMANKFLEAIDNEFGSNFEASGNIAKAADFPTNYSATLR